VPDFLLLQDDDKTISILSFTDVPLPLRQTNFPKSLEISRIKVLHWIKRIVPNYIRIYNIQLWYKQIQKTKHSYMCISRKTIK
jgi:hypothetical protein